ELDGAGAGPLEGAHGVADIEGIAEAGVGIDDDRQLHRVTYGRRVLDDLRQPDEAEVGQPQIGVGKAGTGEIDGLEVEVGDNAGRQRVRCSCQQYRPAAPQSLAKASVDLVVQHARYSSP